MTETPKLLSINDIPDMQEIIEDDSMVFSHESLCHFIEESNNYAFGWFADEKIVGLGYGYCLKRPDGCQMFYLHSIGFLSDYQNKGRGTKLFQYIVDYARSNGFSEVFVITDKGNTSACKVYEKAGAKNEYDNEIVYVIDFKK